MDPIRNPYVPGAGASPKELVGRESLLDDSRTILGRTKLGRTSKSLIFVGLRGVGKTVLLTEIRRLAEEESYHTCSIEAHEDKTLPALLIPHLRRTLLEFDRLGALNEHVKRGLRALKSFANSMKLSYGEIELSLDIDAEPGTADSGDIEADLPDLLFAVGRAAQAREKAVALFVDELQYLSRRDLSALIMGLHRVVQNGLPLVLFGAGLPQIIALCGQSKSYSERLFNFPEIAELSLGDFQRALIWPAQDEGVEFEREALDFAFEQTRGYPYFVQEWGYTIWNAVSQSPISLNAVKTASSLAVDKLDQNFFRVRFDRLTPRERDYLRAMAELGPGLHRSGDIALALRVSVQSVAPLRKALIAKGMIYSPAHGDTAFTVPLFDEFLKRTMPGWDLSRRKP